MEQQDAFSANLFKWDLPQRGGGGGGGGGVGGGGVVQNVGGGGAVSSPPLRLLEAMAAAAAAAAGGGHHHHHHQQQPPQGGSVSTNAYQQLSTYGGNVGGGMSNMNMNMMMMNNNHLLNNGNSAAGFGVRGGPSSSSTSMSMNMNLMNMNAMMMAAAARGEQQQVIQQQQQQQMGVGMGMGLSGGLEEVFQPYGVRHYTAAKIAELGFTVNTLVDMRDEELDDMMTSLAHLFRWDLLVGERYGIKAAIRAERRRLEEIEESRRRGGCMMLSSGGVNNPSSADTGDHHLDAFSQQATEISEDRVQEVVGSGGGTWDMLPQNHNHCQEEEEEMTMMMMRKKHKHKQQTQKKQLITQNSSRGVGRKKSKEAVDDVVAATIDDEQDDEVEDDEDDGGSVGLAVGGGERQREHPFIVTEPGEVARGKKNGLDYLFHLYELCREFLIQVQTLAKERGDKCPTKVTNQVFRFAKKAGATYINKPKMRHYVHCYALHCLDEDTSNALRRAYKERGENVGAWRQACYKPLVAIASRQGWDVDAIFNHHPRLCIWYVPTKLRQLCHTDRRAAAAAATATPTPSAASIPNSQF